MSGRVDVVSGDVSKAGVARDVARATAILLMIAAVLQLAEGVVAVLDDAVLIDDPNNPLTPSWGWLNLLTGLLGLLVGWGILREHVLGNLAGIAVAFLGAVTNFALLPNQPWWSTTAVAVNVLVIWALCVQVGRDRVDDDFYETEPPAEGGATPG